MRDGNQTNHTEFTLVGLTDEPTMKVVLFTVFTFVYTLTMTGNTTMIALILLTPHLHTPMYFFLGHLSFVDLGYSSDIAPRMLVDLLHKSKSISVTGCAVQLFFFCGYGTIEALLLAAMAFDRYVAVCQPLHYMTIMTKRMCVQLMTAVYTGGVLHTTIETFCTFHLTFCQWEIQHFCCDLPPLLKLSCTDTFVNEVVVFIFGGSMLIVSVLGVIISYASIIAAVLRIHSMTARVRVFSTCGSHFIGVILYFGTVLSSYIRPSSSYSLDQSKVVTVLYTLVIPMLNPLIYSLRNKDVKNAAKKLMFRKAVDNGIISLHL